MENRILPARFSFSVEYRHSSFLSAFTLIEMMLTLSLFSLIMATLVLGLRSGSITWKNLKSHQRENAHTLSVVNTIRSDFANIIWVAEDQPPLIYSTQGGESKSIVITAALPMDRIRWALKHEWASIEYRVSKGESSETDFFRTVTPFVGKKPVGIEPSEEILLTGLREVEIGFVTNQGEEVKTWEQQDQPPAAVRFRFQLENGKTLFETFRIPIGFLNPSGG